MFRASRGFFRYSGLGIMFAGARVRAHHAGRKWDTKKALRPRPRRLGMKALRPAEGHGPPTQSWLTPAPADSAGGYFRNSTSGSLSHLRLRRLRLRRLRLRRHRPRSMGEGTRFAARGVRALPGYFRSRRHVRWRTPGKRSRKNAGPVLLGPVSHRARLCVERFAEGLGPPTASGLTPAPADSRLFSK